MKTKYEFISFNGFQYEGWKTKCYDVNNNSTGAMLGRIQWYGEWRQFCFCIDRGMQESRLIFSAGCLADIQDFIRQLMDERKSNVRQENHG